MAELALACRGIEQRAIRAPIAAAAGLQIRGAVAVTALGIGIRGARRLDVLAEVVGFLRDIACLAERALGVLVHAAVALRHVLPDFAFAEADVGLHIAIGSAAVPRDISLAEPRAGEAATLHAASSTPETIKARFTRTALFGAIVEILAFRAEAAEAVSGGQRKDRYGWRVCSTVLQVIRC